MKRQPRVMRRPTTGYRPRSVQQPDDPWQDVAAIAISILLLIVVYYMATALPS